MSSIAEVKGIAKIYFFPQPRWLPQTLLHEHMARTVTRVHIYKWTKCIHRGKYSCQLAGCCSLPSQIILSVSKKKEYCCRVRGDITAILLGNITEYYYQGEYY